MSTEQRQITLTETADGYWTAREDPAGRTAQGDTPKAALDALGEADGSEPNEIGAESSEDEDESAFARELSRKSIANQYGNDYFGQNPGWADDLEDLGENA